MEWASPSEALYAVAVAGFLLGTLAFALGGVGVWLYRSLRW